MTIQAFNILPKVEEVDRSITPALQARVREVHPELCFHAMNAGRALGAGKKSRAGRDHRHALLRRAGIEVPRRLVGAAPDDLLDAGAALWGARRIAAGTAGRVPVAAPLDSRGLRMEICW
jgi:predicted RNase H-like nuclease